MDRATWGLAGAMGVVAVACGAFGAHALAGKLDARGERLWTLASHYLLVHAAVLAALAALGRAQPAAAELWPYRVAAVGLSAGASLFAGSLYTLALGGPPAFGAVAPIGGMAMLAGWAALGLLGLLGFSAR